MKEWKIHQQAYHRLHPNPADVHPVVEAPGWSVDPATPTTIVSYFQQEWLELIQPHKSFAVAVVYANLLDVYGLEHYDVAIADPTLLWNDKYYQPKQGDVVVIYDRVECLLTANNLWDFAASDVPQVISTVDYFIQEFIR